MIKDNIENEFKITQEEKEIINHMCKKALDEYRSAITRLQNA